jgi:hypothetical protein
MADCKEEVGHGWLDEKVLTYLGFWIQAIIPRVSRFGSKPFTGSLFIARKTGRARPRFPTPNRSSPKHCL